MTTLKAILFDLDHTLIDWDHAEPWEDYQSRRLKNVYDFVHTHLHPLDGADEQSFFIEFVTRLSVAWEVAAETFTAPDIHAILTKTIRSFGVPANQMDLDGVMKAYNWDLAQGERAFPDVIEVLPQLAAHGVELGIVTNASHHMIYRDRELQAVGLLDLFPRCRVAAVDVGYVKPHRVIFERALEQLGVCASEAVFVGDSLEADIRGAKGAGMYAVWRARHEERDRVPAGDMIPDGTIETLHDLLPLLDSWYPGWRNGASA